ncbi:hypothetical protein ES703_24512 [subsurface metagenome]
MVDLRGQVGGHIVLLEEYDEVSDVLILGPGLFDLLQLDFSDSLNLLELIRFLRNDIYGFRPEFLDDPLRQNRAHASDQSGREKLLDSLD